MTPYLVKVPGRQGAESQLCCVLLAERVHSGYEGNGQRTGSAGPSLLPWFRHNICKADSSQACHPALGTVSTSLETEGIATLVLWPSMGPLPGHLLMQLVGLHAGITHPHLGHHCDHGCPPPPLATAYHPRSENRSDSPGPRALPALRTPRPQPQLAPLKCSEPKPSTSPKK